MTHKVSGLSLLIFPTAALEAYSIDWVIGGELELVASTIYISMTVPMMKMITGDIKRAVFPANGNKGTLSHLHSRFLFPRRSGAEITIVSPSGASDPLSPTKRISVFSATPCLQRSIRSPRDLSIPRSVWQRLADLHYFRTF